MWLSGQKRRSDKPEFLAGHVGSNPITSSPLRAPEGALTLSTTSFDDQLRLSELEVCDVDLAVVVSRVTQAGLRLRECCLAVASHH